MFFWYEIVRDLKRLGNSGIYCDEIIMIFDCLFHLAVGLANYDIQFALIVLIRIFINL